MLEGLGRRERLGRIDPNMGRIVTMRSVARLETLLLQLAFWVSLVLGGLALLLTVSGLFSVLSYLVERRTREIGVRMALGATSGNVTRLMLAQTTRPVIYGLSAGAGWLRRSRPRSSRRRRAHSFPRSVRLTVPWRIRRSRS